MASNQPPIEDPLRATGVVGALSVADLGPFGRAPLRLLFVLAATVTAIAHAALIHGQLSDGAPPEVLASWIVAGVDSVLVVLLPAALLTRIRNAWRTHRVLFAGLAVGAATELVRLIVAADLTGGEDGSIQSIIASWAWVAVPVGTLLVGVGLLRLRSTGPTRRGLAVVIAALFLALALLQVGVVSMEPGVVITALSFVINAIVAPLVAAFASWVAVDAWLAREAPTRFWTLIAAALPLQVIASLFGIGFSLPVLIAAPSNPDFANSIGFVSAAGGSLLVLWALGLALVAYARFAPRAVAQD